MRVAKKRILPLLLALITVIVTCMGMFDVGLAEGEPEELDFTGSMMWDNVYAWNIVDYSSGSMVVTAHENGYGAFVTKRQDIGNYHTAFKFTYQVDAANLPVIVLRRTDTDNIAGGAFVDDNSNGYYLKPEGTGYDLYKGGSSPTFIARLGVNFTTGTYELDISVQDTNATTVSIIIKCDGEIVANMADSGDIGETAAYTGTGYAAIYGYKSGYTLASVAEQEEPDTPEEIDLRNQAAWDSLLGWNIVDFPPGAMQVTAHESGAGAFATVRRDIVSYHTAFDFTLETGKMLPRIIIKGTDSAQLANGAFIDNNSDGYFLKPEGNGYDLYKGAATPTFLARLGVDFTAGTHRMDITVRKMNSTTVQIIIKVDDVERANVTDSGDIADKAAYTGPGFIAIGGVQSGYTIGTPVTLEELDFSSQSVWEDSLGWSRVSYRRGRMTVEKFDAYNVFNTQRKNLTNYHTNFYLTPQNDARLPRIILKETDQSLLEGGAFVDGATGYYLRIDDDLGLMDLYKGSTFLARVPDVDMNDGKNELDITVYDASETSVRVIVKVDGQVGIDYTDSTDAKTGAGYAGIGAYLCGFVISTDEDSQDEDRLKVLVVGNGVTYMPSGYMTGWTGNWGAAASAQEKDYVNQLLAKLQVKDGYENAEIMTVSSLEWEESYTTYSLSKLQVGREFNPDIIIMQVGDIVDPTYASKYSFSAYYAQLIDFFNKSGNAAVVCCTTFVENSEIDKCVTTISRKYGYPIARLGTIASDDSNKPTYGTGEGQVENYDLLNYPNDKGMLAIAELLYKHVSDLLEDGDGLRSAWLYDAKTGVDIELQNGIFEQGTKLTVTPVKSGEQYDAALAALGDYRIAAMMDISITNSIASPEYRIAVSRPSYTFYEELELYWLAADGTLNGIDANVDDDPLVFTSGNLGMLVIAYAVDMDSIYGDNLIDEFEIEKVIMSSPDDCILFTCKNMEFVELAPLAFGFISDQKRPLRFIFADGSMEISPKVFGAIASVGRLTGFGISRATSRDATLIQELARQREIELINGVYFEVAILRDGRNISLSLPIDVKLSKAGLTDLKDAKMLCIEEDEYITAVNCTYASGIISFNACNFNLYTMARLLDGENLNPSDKENKKDNPETGLTGTMGMIFGGLAISSAGVIATMTAKRRRRSRADEKLCNKFVDERNGVRYD